MNPDWEDYINSLPEQDNYHLVPVAIEREGFNQTSSGRLKNFNCIRAFDWPTELKKEYAILFLSHELYRFGLKGTTENSLGIDSSIRLFLSHAKKRRYWLKTRRSD